MDRALRIPEVVHHVMEYLVVLPSNCSISKDEKMFRATLLNAALTCSWFSGPALDVLWHTMDDLIPLFKLLPNFEVSLDRTLASNIWGGISDDRDVSTFDTYARRIRRYHAKPGNNIHLSAYTSMLRSCGRSYLLPNLVHFQLARPYTDEVLFLLCPSLQELVLPGQDQGSRDNPRFLLNSLKSMSPNLVDLTLKSLVLDNRCLAALCNLTRLEKLVIRHASSETTPITLDFLIDMSARHTLRHFELEGGDLEVVPSLGANRDPVRFSALEHIHIDCDLAIDSIATVLRHATFPVLEVFKIDFEKLVGTSQQQKHWHQVFDHISRTTTDHLKALEFTSCGPAVRLHLFDLPKLDTLSLTSFALTWVVLGLNHRDLTTIIDAWPRLTSLTLVFGDHDEMDFSALISIAHGLPLLRFLTISIDATEGLESIPLLSHDLQSLTLMNSSLDDAKCVARSLDRLFPHLQFWDTTAAGEPEDLWIEVDVLLDMLHDVRKDDTLRVAGRMSEV